MQREVTVLFPGRESRYRRANQRLDVFPDNSHVVPFSTQEEEQLLAVVKKSGRPISHLIFNGSITGVSVAECIPQSLKDEGLYRQIHVATTGKDIDSAFPDAHRDYIGNNPESLVEIGPNGGIHPRFKRRLEEVMVESPLVILGGGPGNPGEDKFFRPVIQAVEKGAKAGTPLIGICLGHQLIGQLWSQQKRFGKGVEGGYLELGAVTEFTTPKGQNHPVFGRFGERVTLVHFNEYHVDHPSGHTNHSAVLTINQAMKPSAIEFDLDKRRQALTWQGHPEVQISQGSGLSIPYAGLVSSLSTEESLDNLQKKYDIEREDLTDLIAPQRIQKNLGKDFYGPALLYMLT